MKKILLLIFFVIISAANAQELDKLKGITVKEVKIPFEKLDINIQKNYSYQLDKFNKAYFLQVSNAQLNHIRPYITIVDNLAVLRLLTFYYGKDWIFLNKVMFVIDGINYEYEAHTVKRDVMSGSLVMESSDMLIDENILTILKKIIQSKNDIEVRLSGEKNFDYKMDFKEKENIKLLLEVYHLKTD